MTLASIITVDLLDRIRSNRASHRDLFLKAQKGYRKEVIKELDQMMSDAKEGKPIGRFITLPEPEDHTDDYDVVIDMLEMSVSTSIELSNHEFRSYVRDEWAWSALANATNIFYVSRK